MHWDPTQGIQLKVVSTMYPVSQTSHLSPSVMQTMQLETIHEEFTVLINSRIVNIPNIILLKLILVFLIAVITLISKKKFKVD
jgi:hypothetical protein